MRTLPNKRTGKRDRAAPCRRTRISGTMKLTATVLTSTLLSIAPSFASATDIAAPAATTNSSNDLQQLINERDGLIELLQKKIIRLKADARSSQDATSSLSDTNTTALAANTATPSEVTESSAADPQATERALERALTQSGALLLPAGQAEVQFGASYASSQQQLPYLFLHDGQAAIGLHTQRRGDLNTSLTARIGIPFDAQLELTVPYRRVTQSVVTSIDHDASSDVHATASMVGDISAGFAKTLLHEEGGRPDVIGRISANLGNGRDIKNTIPIGEGFKKIRSELTLLKRVDPLVFTGNFSYESTFKKNLVKPGDQFGVALSAMLATSPDTSLSIGIDQAFIKKMRIQGVGVPGSDQVSGVLLLGATSIVGKSTLLSVTIGKGLTKGTPDYFVNVAVPIRFDLFK